MAITISSRWPTSLDQLADQPLGVTRPVRRRRVDQGAAGLAEHLQQSPRLLGGGVPAPGHGAEPEPGDPQPAVPTRRVSMVETLTARRRRVAGGLGVADYRWSGMRLGLNLGYLVGADDPRGQLRLTRHAESLGYEVVWAAEAYGSDSPTVLAWLAAQTSTIDVGSAVMQIPARTPAMTAMTAASLDLLSGGRFRLGLGVSGPQVSEGWHGVRFDRPLARTREFVEIVKLALSRRP